MGMNRLMIVPALLFAVGTAHAQSTGGKVDRHAGYYYPPPKSTEVYEARSRTMPDADRTRRLSFVVGLTQEMLRQAYPPQYAIFAKGTHAEKLIIVSLTHGSMSTVYRARAVLAMLTSVARATPLFAELGVQTTFTFFDFAKFLGFKQITVSDGETFAHQVKLE